MKKNFFLYFLLAIMAILLAACGSATEKGSKPSADWSRSASLGKSLVGSLGIAVESSGEQVHLVWPYDNGEGIRLRYVQLNQQALPVVTSDLSLPGQLRAPRLVETGEDRLHLFWARRTPGSSDWELWHAFMGPEGDLVGEPSRVSPDGMDVGSYQVTSDGAGGALTAWGPRQPGDISLMHLDRDGKIVSGPLVLASQGESPALRMDPDGLIHVVWLQGLTYMYASVPLDGFQASQSVPVANLVIGTGDSLVGPALGIRDGWGYVLWSILRQSGLSAGTASTEYVSFPVDAPGVSTPAEIGILPDEEQVYLPYEGGLALTQLAEPPENPWESTDFILHPSAMVGEGPELVFALAANQAMRLDAHLQIATVLFSEGQYQGYSFASRTENISDEPVLALDESGNLYLAWREGTGGRKVYYATTEAVAMTSLDRLDAGDFASAILQGGMESLVSIAFMPFIGFGWLLPGFIVLGAWKLFKHQEYVTEVSSWPWLIIAVLLFQLMKFITLPTLTTYVPFSAWIDLPAWLWMPLRIGVPIVIFLVSLYVANKVRLRYSDSTLAFYLGMTITDALLTLAIYGVNFLGVY